jgi:hypothetical protein
MVIKKEGVITVYDDLGDLTAIVHFDEDSRKNIIFSVNEMGFENIHDFLGSMGGSALLIKTKEDEEAPLL